MYRETDEITSLCFVSAEFDQKTGKPFYVRVADLIDGAWESPKIDNSLPKNTKTIADCCFQMVPDSYILPEYGNGMLKPAR